MKQRVAKATSGGRMKRSIMAAKRARAIQRLQAQIESLCQAEGVQANEMVARLQVGGRGEDYQANLLDALAGILEALLPVLIDKWLERREAGHGMKRRKKDDEG
jgi:hypothetical protein